MKIITRLFLLVAIAISSQSCLQKKVVGNGTITENIIPITDYTAISIDGTANLIYEQKDAVPYLKIEVDGNIFPLLKVEVNSDGKLKIRNGDNINIRTTKYNIYTNSKDLYQLEFAGSSKTTLKGKVTTSNLEIDIAGSGEVSADSLICDALSVDIAGSGTINLVGKAKKASYNIAGNGKINTFDFVTNMIDCDIAGSGKVFVSAIDVLNIDIAGSGNVEYKGNPSISKSIAGSGKITKVDTNKTDVTVGVGM